MFFVVSSQGEDTLVNLENGLCFTIAPASSVIMGYGLREGRVAQLAADEDTILRFKELIRKVKTNSP